MSLTLLEEQAQGIVNLSYKGEKKKMFEILLNMKKNLEELQKENV